METHRNILFKAKRKDNGKWVKGYYLYYKPLSVSPLIPNTYNHYIIDSHSIRTEIDPATLSQSIGWEDSHEQRIFENDIVEFVSSPTRSERYLIWWCREMNMMTAVPLDGIEYKGTDYYNHVKYRNPLRYDAFCLMMQDPWGDFRDIKVIGNLFDNPELIEGALND